MADQQAGVTLGYSKSKGQYLVEEIRGGWPVTSYQRSTDMPYLGENATVVQNETVTVHVGDWLSEGEAEALGARIHLTVRPYRLDA
jgi:macrodomain Ter protein organizer (MatP/YcbG family)